MYQERPNNNNLEVKVPFQYESFQKTCNLKNIRFSSTFNLFFLLQKHEKILVLRKNKRFFLAKGFNNNFMSSMFGLLSVSKPRSVTNVLSEMLTDVARNILPTFKARTISYV